jgi:hypothetical protein
MADAKRGTIHPDGFRYILKEFSAAFDGFKPFWKDVRSTLFPLIKDDELDLAIPADPKTLYNPMSKAFGVRQVDLDSSLWWVKQL